MSTNQHRHLAPLANPGSRWKAKSLTPRRPGAGEEDAYTVQATRVPCKLASTRCLRSPLRGLLSPFSACGPALAPPSGCIDSRIPRRRTTTGRRGPAASYERRVANRTASSLARTDAGVPELSSTAAAQRFASCRSRTYSTDGTRRALTGPLLQQDGEDSDFPETCTRMSATRLRCAAYTAFPTVAALRGRTDPPIRLPTSPSTVHTTALCTYTRASMNPRSCRPSYHGASCDISTARPPRLATILTQSKAQRRIDGQERKRTARALDGCMWR